METSDLSVHPELVEGCSNALMRLFHLILESDWALAQQLGEWKPPSLAAQGFVHLSEQAQVLGTANRFFRGRQDLLLLAIETSLVSHPVRYEEGEPGILFPHLYGPLPVSAVVSKRPMRPTPDGHFAAWPD